MDVEASRESAVVLDGYAAATGAQTMFLMTWGRRDGDADNPDLYGDYVTMQGLLADGFDVRDEDDCVISGPGGNRERFLYAVKR